MKKTALFLILTILIALTLGACGNDSTKTEEKEKVDKENTSETTTYESEDGPVEVPANPKRIVVLSAFAGNVMALDGNLVGVDSWSKMNPKFDLEGVEEVSEDNLEKIIELDPDLIIGLSNIKNKDKLNEIAPTVTFTYGKVDYLTQHIEIGKVLNKEEEARAWVEDFEKRAKETGEKIKAEIGEDATVSVIEAYDKQFYVYGDNWGRGTEILYQAMDLNMPEKVKETALKDGYYAISSEVLPDFFGDYVVLSKNEEADMSFTETDTFKNIPAVKNDRVFEVNMEEFYFNDPLTLELQLDFFKKHFLNK
ncbi:ABC transporter substrate-binding protein [Cerasibacillus terrae]|uniref:ABC transporter substrate-binding protein n=1 Tax=Cerasibacillus terrae TaxID=2498845 RepID=A0A5C8NKE8_9BACI|nr:iron-hydroxamate ABC transporter substrate-binding protein [Cerasibacillus terrae]TXL61610.1 ABC transporter substrate-binding protein [Cerasibacillus terrae]